MNKRKIYESVEIRTEDAHGKPIQRPEVDRLDRAKLEWDVFRETTAAKHFMLGKLDRNKGSAWDYLRVGKLPPADHSPARLYKRGAPGRCSSVASRRPPGRLVLTTRGDFDPQWRRSCRMSVIIVMRRSLALNWRHEGGYLDV